jgi:hypothetical protein
MPKDAAPEGLGPAVFFTRTCGYPLFKNHRGKGGVLGTPHYATPGCVGSTHRASLIVRNDDPALTEFVR